MALSRVLARVLPQVAIPEAALKEYYKTRINEYSVQEYKLQQIFISGGRPDAVERTRAANDMLQKEQPFEEVARLYSDDAGKMANTGFTREEDLVPELKSAIKLLLPGMYSAPVQTQDGFHIVKLLEDRKGTVVPFETARESIQQKLYQENGEKNYKEYMEKLRSNAYIEMKI